MLLAAVQSSDFDAQLYLLEDCWVEATCLVGADQYIEGQTERITFTNTSAQAQDAYLVIGGAERNGAGAYALTVELR